MNDLTQQCADANARVDAFVNRSSAQHQRYMRAMRAPIVRTDEQTYTKPLHGYVDLDQRNSDGSSPHSDTRDMVEIVLDIALVVLALGSLTFVVFSLIGFFWSK